MKETCDMRDNTSDQCDGYDTVEEEQAALNVGCRNLEQ